MKKLYKIVIKETISSTAYVLASNKNQAIEKAIFEDINSTSNQDLEQKVIKINRVSTDRYPLGIIINE